MFKNNPQQGMRDEELMLEPTEIDSVFEELEEDSYDLNQIQEELSEEEYEIEEDEPQQQKKSKKEKKPKKEKKSWFSKKKKKNYENESDIYYGLEFKPLGDLKKGYNETSEKQDPKSVAFTDLFGGEQSEQSKAEEANYNKIQEERRKRVAHAVETAGATEDELADEFGVVAPIPVTSISADPYTKQHGMGGLDENDQFQKAMTQTAESQTMEIKLNVLNDTVELQKNITVPQIEKEELKETISTSIDDEIKEKTALDIDKNVSKLLMEEEARIQPFPVIEDVAKYRDKTMPVHAVKADLLQNAINQEARIYEDIKTSKKPVIKKHKFDKDEDFDVENDDLIHDYTEEGEAKSIFKSLKSDIAALSLKILVSAISSILLLILTLGFEAGASTADPNSNPNIYLIVNLLVLGANIYFFRHSVLSGIKNLIDFKPDADSASAFAIFAILLQNLLGFIFPQELANANVYIYNLLAVFALFTTSIGKYVMTNRIYKNFRFVTSREQKYVIKNYEEDFTKLKSQKFAYQKKAGFLKNFLHYSYKVDAAEKISSKVAPLGVIASLALFLTVIILTQNTYLGVSTFAASACAWLCLSNMLTINLPLSKLNKTALRSGAMATNYDAANYLSQIDTIVVDESGIFPSGTVLLEGVNTLGNEGESTDYAIFAATGLAREVGGTIFDILSQISNEFPEDFPNPSAIAYEGSNGFSGIIDGKKVAIGDRSLMLSKNIEIEEDIEDEYIKQGKNVLFIAYDNKAVAMLIVSYKVDKRRQQRFESLEKKGLNLAVRVTNPNLSEEFICSSFKLDTQSISVITGDDALAYDQAVSSPLPKSAAIAATKGRTESFMNLVMLCKGFKKSLSLVVTLQAMVPILSFIMVALMAIFSQEHIVAPTSLFLFQIFWLLVCIIYPKIYK